MRGHTRNYRSIALAVLLLPQGACRVDTFLIGDTTPSGTSPDETATAPTRAQCSELAAERRSASAPTVSLADAWGVANAVVVFGRGPILVPQRRDVINVWLVTHAAAVRAAQAGESYLTALGGAFPSAWTSLDVPRTAQFRPSPPTSAAALLAGFSDSGARSALTRLNGSEANTLLDCSATAASTGSRFALLSVANGARGRLEIDVTVVEVPGRRSLREALDTPQITTLRATFSVDEVTMAFIRNRIAREAGTRAAEQVVAL